MKTRQHKPTGTFSVHPSFKFPANKKILLITIFLLSACFFSFSQTKTINKTIYFENDKYNLDTEEKQKIDSLFNTYEIQEVLIDGYCDIKGTNAYNDKLSEKRANTVNKYLQHLKINDIIVKINAFGKRKPLNKNSDEMEMAMNRRVEIQISYFETNENSQFVIIEGNVVNENNKPLIAAVSINDMNGNEINTVTSDHKGSYSIKTVLFKNQTYSINYYNDYSFMASQPILITENNYQFRNLKTVLTALKGGNKYTFKNMNFFADSPEMIPGSKPSMEALLKLMKKNKKLIIQIEGHVNYPLDFLDKDDPKVIIYNQALSDERSNTVYKFLIANGIEEKRLFKIGYGARKMLYPYANDDYQMEMNRRVEINVISF